MKIYNLIKNLEPVFGGTQQVWWVLEKITRKSEGELISHENLELTKEQQDKLNLFIEKIKQHYPLQYLLGSVQFLDLDILVKPPVLIPRPETEEWVGDLIDNLKDSWVYLNDPLVPNVFRGNAKKNVSRDGGQNEVLIGKMKILDLCSGSGCIALALAKNFPNSFAYGLDISQNCIDLANQNKTNNKINNVEFILSDLYKNLTPELKFDLIVANPPYISENEFKNLDPEVKNWEDKKALVTNNNGLEIIEKIIKDAKNYLNLNSEIRKSNINQIYIEIGYNQGKEVKQLFKNYNFSNITIIKDLNKRDRVVSAGV